ncbi:MULTISPECIES: ATP synthase F1 subunit epsilon [Commensalibacter]|uniref:ATP synthase epsilon chain n=1 Tax=Commensalibacter melissae TaxID=2070537 RepID=A0A318N3K1_9PROT|nr:MULTISPECIES: ATP synthase F1 subunit epsilon [Commensalibacter]MBH9973421.1 ATP synthase F1 subunit epsilon [Commensalibacter melissae]MBI0015973.1 ATP synthase F1 subunit epsilon [Commensalibacter sp. B14384M2]MBI0017724.1 ATP synthase F1 subunit epsilon [Commensalibacter sp. W8133]MBI0048846.1 ATP synthase F1 subunit epsilon [Commensalibacter sp. B14384M3]MBI0178501.1 ATP synthase F1 subunit epsilon [Commensalibacter sp. W8163]
MSIKLEIISPEKVVLSQTVDMAVLPALEGDIAAMEGHVPMIFLLRAGVIDLYQDNKVIHRLFVEDGFAEMQESCCTVLAKQVRKLNELSEEEGIKRLAKLQEEYNRVSGTNDTDKQRELIDRMQGANAIIDLAVSDKHNQTL